MNPICTHCGKPLRISYEQVAVDANSNPIMDNVGYCDTCMVRYNHDQFVFPQQPLPPHMSPQRRCPRCNSDHIFYQTVTESKDIGCGTIFLYLFLAITILGLLVLIPILLSSKTQTVTYATCQTCGLRWKV